MDATGLRPSHQRPRGNLPGRPTRLPSSRGPITEQLLEDLLRRPHEMRPLPLGPEPDPLHDDDAALALYLCYEQHYVHANLFAVVLQELGLDASYGAYVDRLPAVTLATCNLVSMFGLHRRWRGALVGHLALFEMCSVGPMGRYANAVRRFGLGEPAARFYDTHVVADERHQVVALDDMVDGLVVDEPLLGGEVVFGARALSAVERLFAASLLDAWAAGRSALRPPA